MRARAAEGKMRVTSRRWEKGKVRLKNNAEPNLDIAERRPKGAEARRMDPPGRDL